MNVNVNVNVVPDRLIVGSKLEGTLGHCMHWALGAGRWALGIVHALGHRG